MVCRCETHVWEGLFVPPAAWLFQDHSRPLMNLQHANPILSVLTTMNLDGTGLRVNGSDIRAPKPASYGIEKGGGA